MTQALSSPFLCCFFLVFFSGRLARGLGLFRADEAIDSCIFVSARLVIYLSLSYFFFLCFCYLFLYVLVFFSPSPSISLLSALSSLFAFLFLSFFLFTLFPLISRSVFSVLVIYLSSLLLLLTASFRPFSPPPQPRALPPAPFVLRARGREAECTRVEWVSVRAGE